VTSYESVINKVYD